MKVTWRCEYVRCGKAGCRSCPHGPYWYGYWKEGGKTRKKYHGKADPRPPQAVSGDDDIFCLQTASIDLACRILGVQAGISLAALTRRFRELAMLHHPDRGGDVRTFQRMEAAYSYLKTMFN